MECLSVEDRLIDNHVSFKNRRKTNLMNTIKLS